MKVLHLLASGGTGGIEILCKNIALNSHVDNRWIVLFEEGEIFEELKQHNIEIFSVKNKSFIKKINTISQYCLREKVDVVVVHHGGIKENIIYSILKNRLPDIKYIRYLHGCFDRYTYGNGKNIIKNIIVKIVMQLAINSSDCLIYISNAVKKTFRDNFKISKSQEVVIYNGIGNEFFETPLLNEKQIKDTINIIYIGRLVKVKGVDILIRAFNQIIKISNKKYFLTIVGDGEEKELLQKLVIDLKIDEYIKFEGRQSNVIKFLDKSDIFVYPSIWEEGFGISVVEAMSRGCVPITFNKGRIT